MVTRFVHDSTASMFVVLFNLEEFHEDGPG